MTTTKKTTSKKPVPKKPVTAPKGAVAETAPSTKAAATSKTSTPVKPIKATTSVANVAKPAVVNAPQPVVMGPPIRKKEIIEQVVIRSGLKKRDVKPIVDHLLAVMGDAMADDRELIIPPFGRVKVHKKKDAAKKMIFFAKVHQNTAPNIGGTPSKQDEPDD